MSPTILRKNWPLLHEQLKEVRNAYTDGKDAEAADRLKMVAKLALEMSSTIEGKV